MKTPAFLQDTWVRANWDSFLAQAGDPVLKGAKFYYNRGWMRVEMSPVGPAHARDNNLLAQIVGVFALGRDLRVEGYVTPSLRASGLQEAQPDLAFYVGQIGVRALGTRPVDLGTTEPPALVVEVSATTLDDDLTAKRELYARMGVREYWVVDAMSIQVNMFCRDEQSEELVSVKTSEVLRDLTPAIIEEALRRGRMEGDAAALRYILSLPW